MRPQAPLPSASANALGTIYENAAGVGVHEDFHRLVAVPVAMQDFEPGDGGYVTGADSIHPACPFRISTRDLARFGLLFLRGGPWGGTGLREEVVRLFGIP